MTAVLLAAAVTAILTAVHLWRWQAAYSLRADLLAQWEQARAERRMYAGRHWVPAGYRGARRAGAR